jgi:vancomycin permeability regulator SanA
MKTLICILSGDTINTKLRVDKALKIYQKRKAERLFLNGFNKNWKKDQRLKEHLDKLSRINTSFCYARNTVENIVKLREYLEKKDYKRIIIVSSKTHIKRIKMILKFILNKKLIKKIKLKSCKEVNKIIEKENKISERLRLIIEKAILEDIPKNCKDIVREYNKRRYSKKIEKEIEKLTEIFYKRVQRFNFWKV